MSSPLISDTAFWAACARALCHELHQLVQQEVLPRFERTQIVQKADGSLLTDADTAVQYALPAILSAIYPAPFLGEEMPAEAQAALWQASREGHSALWIADPIDGTTNFAHGLPWFATSVALVYQGQTVLGATLAPALNQIWHASLGGGSFCNDVTLQLPPMPRHLKDCVVGVDMTYLPAALRHHIADLSPAGIARGDGQSNPWRGWRSLGASTLEWCALASGQIHAYVHGGQMPWDAAAGKLILAEAGGFSATLDNILYQPAAATPLLAPTGYAAAAPSIWPLWQHWLQQHTP
jgi:myo-inositol-1(or 4)-monophosphatase